jgi:capsular exopolysaccharide synthesis family protein
VSLIAPDSVEAEQYRTLRYAVEYTHKTGECTIVGICSPLPGDGKSITAINLAGSLGQDPRSRVLLLEADLRRPYVTMGDHLAQGNIAGRGLVDAILDLSISFDEVIQRLPHFNLSILPAGKRSSTPYEALNSDRFGELLAQARQRYDYVIIDSPPIVPVPDCRLIARWVDSFIMVVAAHRTPRDAVDEAISLINPERIMGLVFNGYDRAASRSYGYGYGTSAGRGRSHWWNRKRNQ